MLHQGLVYRQQSQSPLLPWLGRETCKRLPINWWAFPARPEPSSSTNHPVKVLELLETCLSWFCFYFCFRFLEENRGSQGAGDTGTPPSNYAQGF